MANKNHLQMGSFDVVALAKKYGTPLYIYDASKIREAYKKMDTSIPYKPKQLHFAMMCNNRPDILKVLKKLGSAIQANSPKEYEIARKSGFTNDKISVATTNTGVQDMTFFIKKGAHMNLDSIEEIQKYGELVKKLGRGNRKIGIRVFTHIKALGQFVTNKPHKFKPRVGIKKERFSKAKAMADKYSLKITGLHGYIASNMLELAPFIKLNSYLASCAKVFPDIEYINFGSGFGLPPTTSSRGFDLAGYSKHISGVMESVSKHFGRKIILRIEPGRSILGNAGILLAQVTNIKDMDTWTEVGVDCGFGVFARPYIYGWEQKGGYHEIVATNKINSKATKLYTVCGNTVLQGDYLGEDRKLPKVEVGDILGFLKTGAYGAVMMSSFPGMRMAGEVLIDGSKIKVINETEKIR